MIILMAISVFNIVFLLRTVNKDRREYFEHYGRK
jgi:hypothetical protein